MKKLGVLVLASGMLLGTSGCGSTPTAEPVESVIIEEELFEMTHRLSDGREVVCLLAGNYPHKSVSCDWDNAE